MAERVDDDTLLEAYLDAVYACGDERRPLVIGAAFTPRPGHGRLHALLTACNPDSHSLAPEINAARLSQLRQRIEQAGIAFSPGESSAPDGSWHEDSFWLTDAEPLQLDVLARQFGQNACVTVADDGIVRLRLYRNDWHTRRRDDSRLQLASTATA